MCVNTKRPQWLHCVKQTNQLHPNLTRPPREVTQNPPMRDIPSHQLLLKHTSVPSCRRSKKTSAGLESLLVNTFFLKWQGNGYSYVGDREGMWWSLAFAWLFLCSYFLYFVQRDTRWVNVSADYLSIFSTESLFTFTAQHSHWQPLFDIEVFLFLFSSWWSSASSCAWTPSCMSSRCCPSGCCWPCCDSSPCRAVASGKTLNTHLSTSKYMKEFDLYSKNLKRLTMV